MKIFKTKTPNEKSFLYKFLEKKGLTKEYLKAAKLFEGFHYYGGSFSGRIHCYALLHGISTEEAIARLFQEQEEHNDLT